MGVCVRRGCLLVLTMHWAWQCSSLKVTFRSDQALYVALNRTLVLEALIDPDDADVSVTWDRGPESGQGQGKVRLYPSPTKNPRVSTERQHRTLRVVNFTKEDYGRYIIIVTDTSGSEFPASRVVKESEVPPSVSIPLLCEVSRDSEQWDTPTFVWLEDGRALSDKSANLSADGSKLYPPKTCVRNYTCVATSSLGTSSNHFYNSGCDTKPEGCTTSCVPVWLFVVVIVVFLGIIGIIIWKTRRDPVPVAQPTEQQPINHQHPERRGEFPMNPQNTGPPAVS